MSATNRGDGSNTDPSQLFQTPSWCVHRLLDRVKLPSGLWLEPCAGPGAIIKAVERRSNGNVIWHAIESRAECIPELDVISTAQVAVHGNFLQVPPDDRYAVVLTNPPYSAALKFVQHALLFAPIVVFLLRLNWLAGSARSQWIRRHVPNVYVLPQRPSFCDGGTDATDYAWMMFHREETVSGLVEVLDDTPATERRPGPARDRGQKLLFAE